MFAFSVISYIFLILEISFDDEAFSKLVLNKTTKDLIETLVKFKFTANDIISEKGHGCNFLLHGPPGGLLFLLSS